METPNDSESYLRSGGGLSDSRGDPGSAPYQRCALPERHGRHAARSRDAAACAVRRFTAWLPYLAPEPWLSESRPAREMRRERPQSAQVTPLLGRRVSLAGGAPAPDPSSRDEACRVRWARRHHVGSTTAVHATPLLLPSHARRVAAEPGEADTRRAFGRGHRAQPAQPARPDGGVGITRKKCASRDWKTPAKNPKRAW
jgi:hypothetical protein